jgi:hypothetical protein
MKSSRSSASVWIRLAVFLAGAVVLGVYLATEPIAEALAVAALLATWVFLGIPACCGLKE